MDSVLSLIGRTEALFAADINRLEQEICELVAGSSFLVLGGAGKNLHDRKLSKSVNTALDS